MFKRMVSGVVAAVLLMGILLPGFHVYSVGVSAYFPQMSTGTVKTVESSDSGDGLDVSWEHALLDYTERSNFVCVDENSAELVIGINGHCYAEMKNLITSRCRGRLTSTISIGGEIAALVCDMPFETMPRFLAEMRSGGFSRYMEPNVKFHANSVPDDPYLGLQWALKKIEAFSAWNITTGNPQVLVAIIDTGVEYDHPDLARNYAALGYDWVNNDTDPMDDNGHGTHCAGIIAAGLNNSIGIAGVAQIRFFAEKGLNQYGSGYSSDLADAICHAVDQGAKIISCSWGSYEGSELIHDAIRYAREAGAVVIASAGNDAWDLKGYPAAYKEVIAVAATDWSDNPTGFTNYGDWVELSAPGDLIFSTMRDSAYSHMSGTSMSTPFVAGVAALVWSRFPNMTRDQVIEQLFETSDDLGEAGFDIHYGYGRINARRAVEQALPKTDVLILEWQKNCTTVYCEPGEPIALNVTLLNFGTSDQSNVTSQMLINGGVVDSRHTGFLKSGGSETVCFQWTPRLEGIYNVTAYVMPAFDENFTDNNALTTTLRVRAPRITTVGKNNCIQDVIDSAYPGDTLQVDAGTYYEHLTVNKSLSLVGGKGGITVIDGNGTGTVVHVLADSVNVTGFNIRNGNRGICLDSSDRNTIASNTISNNSKGLILLHSGNNKITNNSMIDNKCSFCVEGDFDKYVPSQFVQDMDSSNTIDRKPVYYWVDQHNKQVPSDAGYVAIIDSTNITIKDLSLSGNSQGVLIAYTEGLVIENMSASQDKQGMLIVGSFDCTVQGNILVNNDCGIDIRDSLNITVTNNTVVGNTDGLSLRHSSSNIVDFNTIAANYDNGIFLEYSPTNEIRGNTVSDNFGGIHLQSSGSGILRNNNVTKNVYNFGIDGRYLQDFILDIDTSNAVDGKPVYYILNRHNLVINPSTFPNAGYLGIVNCTNVTVEDLGITSNSQGILLAYTNNSTIENVNTSGNWNGIYLFGCDENTIRENVISNNTEGIALHFSSNNEITGNTVMSNMEFAIYMASSSNNWIRNNTFSESKWGFGVILEDSSRFNSFVENNVGRNLVGIFLGVNEPHGNKIYHNNFIGNTNQAMALQSFWIEMNVWNDGKGQGNYWSDYKGEDSNGDGIGDTRLPHLDTDHFPLMTKHWNEADVNHDGKVDILDVVVVAKAFGSKTGDPKWNGKADLDNNGVINMLDISRVSKDYGKTV